MKGTFNTFEGIDGSGKSTQLRLLESKLRSSGVDLITTCEPGGTPLGRNLRAAFLETTETVAPMAEMLAFGADRAQHVEYLIKPALERGQVVISDRYADATYAYQGAGRGFPEEQVLKVIELATAGLQPHLTLFFDITVADALSRMAERPESHTKRNRMDAETAAFYERVRNAYLQIAEREPERFRVVDGARDPELISREVESLVRGIIG